MVNLKIIIKDLPRLSLELKKVGKELKTQVLIAEYKFWCGIRAKLDQMFGTSNNFDLSTRSISMVSVNGGAMRKSLSTVWKVLGKNILPARRSFVIIDTNEKGE